MRNRQVLLAKSAIQEGKIQVEDTLVYIQDFEELSTRLEELSSSFSVCTSHAVAIKSNPLHKTLRYIQEKGYSAEAASLQEVKLALSAGFGPNRIVFDSPVKTRSEIAWCVTNLKGATLNVNSLDELERYPKKVPFDVGLRVQLEESTTSHKSLNVSGERSKFGIPIQHKDQLIQAVLRNEFINELHLHQGSQFDRLGQQVSGIRKIVDLGLEINQLVESRRIKRINIGGGFPVNYGGNPFEINEYAHALKQSCPELWDGTFDSLTEFGRFTHAHAGVLISKIEYVRHQHSSQTLVTHSGADVLMRASYQPNTWNHQLTVLKSDGSLNKEILVETDIAGPLCFGGDYPFKNVKLPMADEGDWLVIHDAGANTLSLWSKHCSRAFPKVIGFQSNEFKLIKTQESDEDVISFWK
jgi:diaminopimelate decarboxylase